GGLRPARGARGPAPRRARDPGERFAAAGRGAGRGAGSVSAEVRRDSLLRRWHRRALRGLPLAVFVLVYFLVLVYPPLRIGSLAWPGWQPDTPTLALLMAGPAAGRLACEWLSGWGARLLGALVMTWLGITFIGLCVLLPWELAALVL